MEKEITEVELTKKLEMLIFWTYDGYPHLLKHRLADVGKMLDTLVYIHKPPFIVNKSHIYINALYSAKKKNGGVNGKWNF